jgi:hypothetical protein
MSPLWRRRPRQGRVAEEEKDEADAAARRRAPPPPSSAAPSLQKLFTSAFLPSGYPDSVTPDYAAYVRWNAAQALSSYVRGVLASTAVFTSLGVGASNATALAAATLTAVRDINGTLGGIAFATWQGTSFEPSAKQWRIFADVLNDAAMALDLASPLLANGSSSRFLLVASLAALARALVGVAAGATGAALTHHFSRGGRGSAELSAKADSRERAANIVGTLLGVAAARACGGARASWVLFALLTLVHIWANVRAMRCLVLDTFSPARLALLMQPLPAAAEGGRGGRGVSSSSPLRLLPTPEDVAARETLLAPPFERAVDLVRRALSVFSRSSRRRAPLRIVFGAPIGALLREEAERQRRLQQAGAAASSSDHGGALLASLRRRSWQSDGYLVTVARRRSAVLVAVRRGADAETQLRAFAHAARLAVLYRGDEEEAACARWASAEYAAWLRSAAAAGWQTTGSSALLPRPARLSEW